MQVVEPIRDIKKIEQIKIQLKNNSERNYVLFELGINTGLRISDILKLRVKDVKNNKYILLIEQKTQKHRKILITKSIRKILNNYTKKMKSTDYLFRSEKSENPISRIQAYRIIRTACDSLKIRHIGTHSLRKTFGYHFYQKTKDVALLQCILNHSSPDVTLRYIGVTQDIIDKSLTKFCL